MKQQSQIFQQMVRDRIAGLSPDLIADVWKEFNQIMDEAEGGTRSMPDAEELFTELPFPNESN